MSNVYKSSLSGGGAGDDAKAYHTDDTAFTDLADGDYIPVYDTSASTQKKTLWSNIKSVLTNTFQPKLTAGNNISINSSNRIDCAVEVIGTFSKSDVHSTTEKVVGCWTDGRPLYQVSFEATTPSSNSTDKVIYTLPSSGINIIKVNGTAYAPADAIRVPLSYANITSTFQILLFTTGNKVYCRMEGGDSYWFNKPICVTVQYTKDSDAANSYNYTDENNYSTDEHIIGTWVDGSTLYQRTFTGTVSSTLDTTTVSSFGNYTIISFDGAINGSGEYFVPMLSAHLVGGSFMYPYRGSSAEQYKLFLDYSSDFRGRPYYLTVKYIK